MTVESLKEIFGNLFLTILMTAGPILLVSLLIGLVISFFQAVTQIQEFTLTFVPKIIGVFVCFYLMLPWMAGVLIKYTNQLFDRIPLWVK